MSLDRESIEFQKLASEKMRPVMKSMEKLIIRSFGTAGLNALEDEIWVFHGLLHEAFMEGAALAESRAINKAFQRSRESSNNMLRACLNVALHNKDPAEQLADAVVKNSAAARDF